MYFDISERGFRCAHSVTEVPDARTFTRHAHMEYEILFFRTGEADCVIEHLRRTLRPGEMVLIPPMAYHFIALTGTSPYERTVIDFTECAAPPALLHSVFSEPRVLDTSSCPEITALLARMDTYAARFPAAASQMLLRNLTSELVCLLSETDEKNDCAVSGFSSVMEEAMRYIDANIADIAGLDELCAQLYVSRAYLHRMFTESLGISPMRYITSKRLWLAQSRLRLGEKPTQVCTACGFRDYSAFYRAYKDFFGVTPGGTRAGKSTSVPGECESPY